MEIAIIDDGVNNYLYNVGKIKQNIEITSECKIYEVDDSNSRFSFHGTTCAAIMRKYCPDAILNSIKILNDNGRCLKDQLLRAIQWCIDNEIKLINISLGTIDFRDFEDIRNVVNAAYDRGLIIVAACSNRNIYTCPASLSDVIGVKCDMNGMLKEGEFLYHCASPDGIEIIACASHTLMKLDGVTDTVYPSNSFAAPLITAVVYDILIHFPDLSFDGVKEELFKRSNNSCKDSGMLSVYRHIDWAKNAVVFHLYKNRKTAGCNRFIFDLKDEVDIECNSTLDGFDRLISYIHDNGVSAYADTIIAIVEDDLEHTCDVESKLFNHINGTGMSIIYIDDKGSKDSHLIKVRKNRGTKIWRPLIYKINGFSFEKESDIPLISVFDSTGVESFKVVYKLKELLRKDGYNAVACIDLCKGVLFGLEYAPSRSGEEHALRLNELREVYDPDILISGNSISNCNSSETTGFAKSDISIIITDNPEIYKNYIQQTENIILILHSTAIDDLNFPDIKVFHSTEKDTYCNMYKYIIDLFQNR